MFGTEAAKDDAIRRCAAGGLSFAELRRGGIESYVDVPHRPGDLGLRLPIAPLEGPNAELRRCGRELIAERLRST